MVVRELQQGKDNVPLIGGGVNKWAKHLLDGAIGSIGLAVGLGMIGGREGEGGAEVFVECLLKGTCETGVTVGDNGIGEAVALKDMREEEGGKRGSINVRSCGDEMTHLGETVKMASRPCLD